MTANRSAPLPAEPESVRALPGVRTPPGEGFSRPAPEAGRSAPWRESAGIALISLATLMFELVVNKALSFSTWGVLGYMVIGSAIFGFSIAGVAIALWAPQRRHPLDTLLAGAAFVFSAGVVGSYVVMNVVPFNFENLLSHPVRQLAAFTAWYLALLVPFTATGFIVALLLLCRKERANRLYAADLVGAGVGCLIVVPLFPLVGPSGQYLVCAAVGAAVTLLFARGRTLRLAAAIVLPLALLAAPFAESVFPVQSHENKRGRMRDLEAGFITRSLWSFLSKIEVAERPARPTGMIWFDGGLMESGIDRWDGSWDAVRAADKNRGANSIAWRIAPWRSGLIIAPAGGRELRSALAWGQGTVTGVELDSSVVRLVSSGLDEYLGGLFNDPRVRLVNDEGRSFVRRSREPWDVIQSISAYSVTAIQSGALNLASSYLMTAEAYDDYLSRLTPNGVLSLSRDYDTRVFFTGWEALERRGLDPAPRLVLLRNDDYTLGRNTLLLRLEPFTEEQLATVREICRDRALAVNYAPPALMRAVDEGLLETEPRTRRILEEFVAAGPVGRAAFYARFPYNQAPVTDDRPFFDHIARLGLDLKAAPDLLTEELESTTAHRAYVPRLPIGIAANLAVLVEAAVLAAACLIVPLGLMKAEGIRTRRQRLALVYFLALGAGFIWIEIVLLKKFILFLGSPVYSISVVLAVLLVSAGLGSWFSERLGGSLARRLTGLAIALALGTALLTWAYPPLFAAWLGLSFPLRLAAAVVLIAPAGFVLGMPMPVGLSFLSEVSPETIPWAWAVNGYMTVVGVSTASLVAMRTGFTTLLALSLVIYLAGFVALARARHADG